MTKPANNDFAQCVFDAREILFPRGAGKGGQRQASDLGNLFAKIASEGEYVEGHPEKGSNGLWWSNEEIAFRCNIHRNNVNKYLDWLRSVGLVKSKARMNSTTINWVVQARAREIVAAQQMDRENWKEAHLAVRDLNDDSRIPLWKPSDDEIEWYFTAQASTSEALTEAHSEPRSEGQTEGLSEPQSEARHEAPDAECRCEVKHPYISPGFACGCESCACEFFQEPR